MLLKVQTKLYPVSVYVIDAKSIRFIDWDVLVTKLLKSLIYFPIQLKRNCI